MPANYVRTDINTQQSRPAATWKNARYDALVIVSTEGRNTIPPLIRWPLNQSHRGGKSRDLLSDSLLVFRTSVRYMFYTREVRGGPCRKSQEASL